jgi:uncharacterized protein (DUF736 family)
MPSGLRCGAIPSFEDAEPGPVPVSSKPFLPIFFRRPFRPLHREAKILGIQGAHLVRPFGFDELRSRPSLIGIEGIGPSNETEDTTMPAIGYVTRKHQGFEGNLNTLTIKAKIRIAANEAKSSDKQPDYLVFVEGVEVGAAWVKKARTSGNEYVSLSIAAPEFGPKKLYANLGVAAGQDDPDTFAIIWNADD